MGLRESPAGGAQLLEREEHLAVVRGALEDARVGRGSVTIAAGGAGLGKTALLDAAREEARIGGMPVLAARGAELEAGFPFGAARQLFEPALMGLKPAARRSLLSGSAALAAPLFSAARDAPPDPEEFVAAGVEGLAWLTLRLEARSLGRSRGIALVLDDAQWIDAPTLRFVARLAAGVEEAPVAVLLGVRDGEGGPARDVLAGIGSARGTRRLRLAELGEEAVGAFVERELGMVPDPAFVGACVRATGGTPVVSGAARRRAASRGGVADQGRGAGSRSYGAGRGRALGPRPPAAARPRRREPGGGGRRVRRGRRAEPRCCPRRARRGAGRARRGRPRGRGLPRRRRHPRLPPGPRGRRRARGHPAGAAQPDAPAGGGASGRGR